MFNEIYLSADLLYDHKKVSIIGFEELANGKQLLFVDHALAIIVKCVKEWWNHLLPSTFHKAE